jgi:uncharacterized protein
MAGADAAGVDSASVLGNGQEARTRRARLREAPPLQFVLKVASRCNLDCTYCYVYHHADDTWRQRPALMPESVFAAALNRIVDYCRRSAQPSVTITFHGGEPCLLGPDSFADRCRRLRDALVEVSRVRLVIQTNGTLLDRRWADAFARHEVDVGISVDGPKSVHDANRVDHRGRGSFDRTARGIDAMHAAGVPFSILSVIPLRNDGLLVHRQLLTLGPDGINYLFPDFTHDSIGARRDEFGRTPCADFLLPIFDEWLGSWPSGVAIPLFSTTVRLVLGGDSQSDALGNGRLPFVFIEADGSIEGLDVLRACSNGLAQTGLNVLHDDFSDIERASELHGATIFRGVPLPRACGRCPERETCAGGYLPHRYSSATGFDNPSVWCLDLLALFDHVRRSLGVSADETALRRRVLEEMAIEAGIPRRGETRQC